MDHGSLFMYEYIYHWLLKYETPHYGHKKSILISICDPQEGALQIFYIKRWKSGTDLANYAINFVYSFLELHWTYHTYTYNYIDIEKLRMDL